MDEEQKTEARNYLVTGGFLITGILCLLSVLSGDKLLNASSVSMSCVIGGFVLFIIGIFLLVLQKRDLAGFSFIVLGFTHLMTIFNTDDTYMVLSLVRGFSLIFGIVLLFSKDKQKWIFAPLNILLGFFCIIRPYCADYSGLAVLHVVGFIVFAIYAIYFALAAGFERIHLPGRNLVTSDDITEIKNSGSAIGYAVFGTVALVYGLQYISLPGYSISSNTVHGIALCFGILMIIIGIMLFTIGKMRFTPVMFMMVGSAELISSFVSGPMMYAMGLLVLLTGLFAIFRQESRILPGMMLIIYGVSYLFSMLTVGAGMVSVVSFLLNVIPAAVAFYLAVAVMSQKKLPLF